MRAYQRVLEQIQAAGGELIAISPQVPDGSLSMAEKNDLRFEVLSDLGNRVAARYGLVFKLPPDLVASYLRIGRDLAVVNGTDEWTLPIPGVFVIDQAGVVRLAHVEPDYRHRLEPGAILAALRSL